MSGGRESPTLNRLVVDRVAILVPDALETARDYAILAWQGVRVSVRNRVVIWCVEACSLRLAPAHAGLASWRRGPFERVLQLPHVLDHLGLRLFADDEWHK